MQYLKKTYSLLIVLKKYIYLYTYTLLLHINVKTAKLGRAFIWVHTSKYIKNMLSSKYSTKQAI